MEHQIVNSSFPVSSHPGTPALPLRVPYSRNPAPFATPSIVVVEDDGLVASDIASQLVKLGYRVLAVVASAYDALNAASQLRPDIVIMDIQLKGAVDGISAAIDLRHQFNIPTVFLTAFADDATVARAKGAEPQGYIVKPFDQRDLKLTLELALHREKHTRAKMRGGMVENSNYLQGDDAPFVDAKTPALEIFSLIPQFESLPRKVLFYLAEQSEFRESRSGELLTSTLSPEKCGFIVVTGRVALGKSSSNGKELVVELVAPGDILGWVIALSGSGLLRHTLRSQTETRVLVTPRSVLTEVFENYPYLYRIFLEKVASHLKHSHECSRHLAHHSVEIRIAHALCHVIPRFALVGENANEKIFSIPMTRQELADLTGTTPETAIRVTKAMERAEVLDLKKPGLIRVVNLAALKSLAEE
jgi:CRP-like cAMP-binding protein/AmiR/NasT family two-component response regulator